MTTRGSIARGQGVQLVFTGRVRKWTKQWAKIDSASNGALTLLKWLPTDDRYTDDAFPRFRELIPVEKARRRLSERAVPAACASAAGCPPDDAASAEQRQAPAPANPNAGSAPEQGGPPGEGAGGPGAEPAGEDCGPQAAPAGETAAPPPLPSAPGAGA
mmetsp:Transcript_18086/g.43285  ORF Transcript_18086/g.43285 Transcript_18086/m.43285 type:complete len:159 (-) Transcript_18086:248-724(-)